MVCCLVPVSAKQVSGLGNDAYILSAILHIKKGAVTATVTGEYTEFAKREETIRYIGEKLLAGMQSGTRSAAMSARAFGSV
jgi:hypothetical protein